MAEPRDPLVTACRDVIREGSVSFAGAARLFGPETREAAYLLYAWCRYCDDQVDCETLGRRSGDPSRDRDGLWERLRGLRDATRRALAGAPVGPPVFLALERVVTRYGIPTAYPLELLDGFEMDVDGRRFEELDDTIAYCYHVAGVVGLMMAHVMGVDEPETRLRAVDLGIAMQMTNIARDVVEDARAGRIYLPLSWLKEAALEPEDLLSERRRGCLAKVVGRLLVEADRYYASAGVGVRRLTFRSAWAVAVARGVYREIGRIVARRGSAAWDARAVVPGTVKALWVARGLVTAAAAATFGRLQAPAPRGRLWTGRVPE